MSSVWKHCKMNEQQQRRVSEIKLKGKNTLGLVFYTVDHSA